MPIRKTPAKSWIEDPQWVFHLHPWRELIAIGALQDVARVVPQYVPVNVRLASPELVAIFAITPLP